MADLQVVLNTVAGAAFGLHASALSSVPCVRYFLVKTYSLQCHRLWRDPRLLPTYIAALSLFILTSQAIHHFVRLARTKGDRSSTSTTSSVFADPSPPSAFRKHVQSHGGTVIWLFAVTRLAGVLVLLALYATSFVGDDSTHELAVTHDQRLLNGILCGVYVRLYHFFKAHTT